MKNRLLMFCLLVGSCFYVEAKTVVPPKGELILWYKQPAINWMTSALPIGNGRIGAMIFGGIEQEQIQFNDKTLWTGHKNERGGYQNFGDVYIRFKNQGKASDYLRYLRLDDATAGVTYKSEGVTYAREYFASFPDNLIVIHLTADKKRKLSFDIEMQDAHNGKIEANNRVISNNGKLSLLSYQATLTILNKDGNVTTNESGLSVNNASEVTILLVAGTDYDPKEPDYLTKGDWKEQLARIKANAENKSYQQLKKDHVQDYQSLFNRVSLHIGNKKPVIPTNELLHNYTQGEYDPALDVLFFQYGRYLTIASSRKGLDLPSNLQGLWNNSNNPPWGGDIHSNINIQMNYWPTEVANLAECHVPFTNYIYNEALLHESWKNMATEMRCRGWALKTQNNIFGYSDFMWNRPANGWYCMHIWDKYLFSLDKQYLETKAYPVIKAACEFWLDRLIVDDDGSLVAPNEWSPEHGPWESGIAYAQQIITDLFINTIQAGKILQTDRAFIEELEQTYAQLDKGLRVGDWGQLREWKHTNDDPNNQHRHVSHLMALYPGKAISPMLDKQYADAARKSLEARGDGGTGWSRVWKIGFWARLLDGNRAHQLVKSSLTFTNDTDMDYMNNGGVYENMLDCHPPFQIDGNLGATACMSELLLQSHLGEIHLLPAIPDTWAGGSVQGMRARGAFDIDMQWKNKMLIKASITSHKGGICKIRTSIPVTVTITGENVVSEKDEKGYYITIINTEKQKTYHVMAKQQ